MKNLILSLACLSVAVGCGQIDNKNSEVKPTLANNSAVSVKNASPVVISAVDLTRAYSKNEIAADEKYRDKPLEVSGKITSISDTLGSLQVDLEGFKESGFNIVTVKCVFDESEKPAIAKLEKGQKTVLQGTGDGMTAGLYVGLTGCKIK